MNSAIADAGGFTMEAWFKWNGAGSVNSLIDYAGTEKIVLDTAQGAGNEVRMRINSDSSLDAVIGTVAADQWHYVAAVFDTQGNTVNAGSITGIFRLYLDGSLADTTGNLTISDFGDSLARPIGVAKHPLNFEADRFDGLVFEPARQPRRAAPIRIALCAGTAGSVLAGAGCPDFLPVLRKTTVIVIPKSDCNGKIDSLRAPD